MHRLKQELAKPVDGSDVDTPRGETAKQEVARLRKYLQELEYEQKHEEECKDKDPYFDLIMDPTLARNEYPEAKLELARAAEHTSLMAQVCTKEVWDKYKDTVSSGPAKWTLARAINTGVMYPNSFVGCHAGDLQSWDDFKVSNSECPRRVSMIA